MISLEEIEQTEFILYKLDAKYSYLEKFNAGGKAFSTASSEETFWLIKGKKTQFKNLSHFWLQTIELTKDSDDEIKPLCKSLKPTLTEDFLNSHKISIKSRLKKITNIEKAYSMKSKWNNWITLLVTDTEFIYLEWGTTA